MTDASNLALTRLASQVSIRKPILLDKDGLTDDRQDALLDDATHRQSIKAIWPLRGANFVDVPAWPVAIPMPYKYYFSLYNPGYWLDFAFFASSITDWSSCEIGSDITYGIPYKILNGVTTNVSAPSSRLVSMTVAVAAWLEVTFFPGSPLDLITWTITVDGTPYTGKIDSTKVGSPDHIVKMPLPTPWDQPKSVSITWTGGDALSLVVTPQTLYVYPVGPSTPASGWTAVKLGMRTGSNSLMDNQCCANMDICYAMQHWFRFYSTSSTSFLPDNRTPTSSIRNTRGVVPLHHANTDQFAKFNPAFLAKEFEDSTLSHFSGFRGFPTIVSGAHKLATVFTPQDQTYSTSSNTFLPLICRSLKKVFIIFYYDPIGGAVLNYTLAVAAHPSGTSLYSTTYTQATPGWVIQTLPLAPYRPSSGTGFGYIKVNVTANYSGGATAGLSGYACLVEEACSLPWAVETSDGHAIPGATHTSALTDPLPSTLVYGGTSTDFIYTDIPTPTKIWHGSFAGTTPGYYILQAYTPGGVRSGLYPIAADGPIAYSIPNTTPSSAILVNSLSVPYFTGESAWGAYGRPDSSYTGAVYRITLTPVTVTPYALSIGDTNVMTSYTTMGTPSHPGTDAYNYLFNSFTASVAGAYSFTLTCATGVIPQLSQIQLWVSATDPYCMDRATPVQTEAIALGIINTSAAPVATLPLGISGQSQRNILLTNGSAATAWNYGVVGATLDWRISTPPVGTTGGFFPQYVRLDNSTWAVRGSTDWPLIKYTRTMAAGETVYLRVSQTGQYRRIYGHPLNLIPSSAPSRRLTWSIAQL